MFGRVDHRPWSLPRGPWVMAQTWRDLLFAHWPIASQDLRPLVPAGLEVDTYEGQAWLGVVPFRMSGVRVRPLPALPLSGAFRELNVRTYVTAGDKPGVLFFSLDASDPLAVAVARRWFHLPYFRAAMSLRYADKWVEYASRRTHPGGGSAAFAGRYRPSGDVFRAAPGSLAHWLTERYCLYTGGPRGTLLRGEIHHAPWPLQSAEVEIATNTMTQPVGLTLPDVPPLLHFARRLDVVVWALAPV